MRVTKTVKALVDAMHQSDIAITKIAMTLEILGFQPQSVRRLVETKGSIHVRANRETTNYTEGIRRVDRKPSESSSCNACFYLKKVIELEEMLSQLRLNLHRLHKKVTLMDEETHRQRSSIVEEIKAGGG